MHRLLNIGLRAATLGSKFVLIFFLARFLEPEAVGLYGLLTAAIGYALYLVGLDFYTYSTREILRVNRNHWGGLLRNHGALALLLYSIVLPLLLLVFAFGFLPWTLAPWFYVLLILEHLNQELSRLLVAVSKQLTASLVLFLRQGLWCLVVIGWMAWNPESRHLEGVLVAWCVGGGLALTIGFIAVRALGMGGWHRPTDWAWVRRGIGVAVPLLIGTLALRGLFTLDRYWFADLNSLQVLGAYVLFIGMCNALMSFLDAGVFAFSYPAMISAHHRGDRVRFKSEVRRMGWLTILCCLGFVVVGVLVLNPLLEWLGRDVYVQHAALFYWLLVPTCLFALGMIPHYGLYAQGRDRPIVRSHVAALVVFIGATAVAAQFSNALAVPLGLIAAFLLVLAWKLVAFRMAQGDPSLTSISLARTIDSCWKTPRS